MKKGQSRISIKTFSSSGHSGVRQKNDDLVNDKLLIDCGEDQDCVLGKFMWTICCSLIYK
jgi:putative lipase involved disintegration of autophagic bodies